MCCHGVGNAGLVMFVVFAVVLVLEEAMALDCGSGVGIS